MGRVDELYNGLKFIQSNTNAILNKALFDHKQDMIKLNQDQLMEGVRSDNVILPKYAPISYSLKRAPIPSHGRYTGYETGDMYKNMYVNIDSENVQILSRGEHTSDFIAHNGVGINAFGLGEESLLVLRPIIKDEMINSFKDILKI